MSISNRELAKKWSITEAAIRKLVKRGMPTDSQDVAETWYRANVADGVANLSKPFGDNLDKGKALTRMSRDDLVKLNQEIQEARDSAKIAMEDPNNPEQREWHMLFMQIAARQLALDKEITKRQKEDADLYDSKKIDDILYLRIRQIKAICDQMPSTLAPRVNPQDPELAQTMLEDWRNNTLYKTLREDKPYEQKQMEESGTKTTSTDTAGGAGESKGA